MTLRHDQLPEIPEPPDTVQLLQKLCDAQLTEIDRLRDQVQRAEEQFHRMQAEQLAESQERKRQWVVVQKLIGDARDASLAVLKQRDVTLDALRRLCDAFERCTRSGGTPEAVDKMEKAYREARELLTLADGERQAHHPDSEG